jgi:uncharacterized membrane protein YozB (DUF420 family)
VTGKELLAAVNASLNSTSAILLIAGYLMIRRGNRLNHARLMVAALCTSAMFLVFYVTSHIVYEDRTSGLDPSPLRTFYFILLATHVVLAIGMLPPILVTVWRAYRRRWEDHKRVAKPTLWIWFYVSATGVIVYWMLYHFFPSMKS